MSESSKFESPCSECQRQKLQISPEDSSNQEVQEQVQFIPIARVHKLHRNNQMHSGVPLQPNLLNLRKELTELTFQNEQKSLLIEQLKEQLGQANMPSINPLRTIANQKSPRNIDPYKRIAQLEKELRQRELQNEELRDIQSQQAVHLQWMEKFIVRFNQMTEELSNTKGKILPKKNISLKNRTKLCWKTIKSIINDLLQE